MATPEPPATPVPPALLSAHDFPCLVAAYLPSPSSDDDDDDDADHDPSFLDHDSPDSLNDWSDDRPDSADDYDHSSDSDDSSLAWNTTSKSKKHSHSHPHPHLHQKKTSFNSACDYLSFFGALRKGFCSRHLDQRIEVYKAHKRADKSTLPEGGDSVQPEKKRVLKTGTGRNWNSEGHTHKDHEGASSFSTMFKCTVADTPKNLLKRASFSGNSDEQDINARQAEAENMIEKDVTDIDKQTRQKAEREDVPELLMMLDRDGKDSSKNLADEPQLIENLCKDMAHKEYEEAHVELVTNPSPNKSKLRDENLNLKEDDHSSKHNKTSEKRGCWRESDKKGPHHKGDWKLAMPDCSIKSSKNHNQVSLMVNTLESKYKGGLSLESNAIQQPKDLQGKPVSSKDNSHEAPELALGKKPTQSEAPTGKAKLPDMPLHIYIKEKHPPEVVVKDPKRKTKAKKVKALKGKKVHLFRDGFTLPSATEPAEVTESAPFVLDRQSESSNKVLSPDAAVKNQIPKDAVSTAAAEDDLQAPIMGKMESNAMEVVDGVSLRVATGPLATSKTSATPVHIFENQVGNPVSNVPGLAVVGLPGSVSKGVSYTSASYQNIEDVDLSKTSSTEGRHAAHPDAQCSGSSEENSMRTVITSTPPLPKSSRRWFPPLDVALLDSIAAPKPTTTMNGSLSVAQPSVGNSLATSTISYSPTALSYEPEFNSEIFGNIQGNFVSTGDIISSASPNPSSFIEAPLASNHLGKTIAPPAIVSSSPRMLTKDTSNAQYSRFMQVPVSQSQAYAPNSVPTLPLQQESNPPALFHVDSRASGNSWIQPGTNSGPGFSFSMVPTTAFFGQVIGCVNQTLSMYKQMKSFSIEARYLVNVASIVPGCCKLFLFNIENRQLHGLYVSSSLQAMPLGLETVAFDCIENFAIPLSVGELDTVLPEARQMDGRPLYLQPHTVEQLVTMFERKNKPRHPWGPSNTKAVSVSGVHGLLESSAVSSESSSSQDRLVEAMGQGSSVISASLASLAINEMAKDCWSPLSISPSVIVPESGQAFAAHEPDSSLAPAQAFPFPASSINNGEGAKSVWPEVAQSGFTRKLPEQGVAPSPMALWPHLFPKASSADTVKENFMHMDTREGNTTQMYLASGLEKNDMGARPDSESEAPSFPQLPESGIRSTAHRPKLAYNPLAVEQGRQRHLFDGSKPSSWSTLVPELDLQQTPQYGNRSRTQDNQFIGSLSSGITEQPKMNNITGGGTTQLSATLPTQLPLHYQMDHALPEALRNDLGLSNTGTAQTTSSWSEEPHLIHLAATSSEAATEAVNLDQTNLCCYCFTKRADHLIIDCQHLGPCLECAASKKIEYCGQLNCQTKVTRLLRLFR